MRAPRAVDAANLREESMADVILHEIPGSPNNLKVRIALNYKEIPFRRAPLQRKDGAPDRSGIIALSRQPLTPVLQHGDTVIFDSFAILRYLEANFPRSRPLFSTNYDAMKSIEEMELYARTEIGKPIGMMYRQVFSSSKDPGVIAKANDLLHESTGRVEKRLAEGAWLVGDDMTAADVTAAAYLSRAMLTPEQAAGNPIGTFFLENLKLGEGRERTREHVQRVIAWDRP
jgi:glutathione S-transferase